MPETIAPVSEETKLVPRRPREETSIVPQPTELTQKASTFVPFSPEARTEQVSNKTTEIPKPAAVEPLMVWQEC